MTRPRISFLGLAARGALATLALVTHFVLTPAPASAGPTVGFVENFAGAGNTAGWDPITLVSNPGTGGIGGASDGFLLITRSGIAAQLGSKNQGLDYVGDWYATGADRVKFSLNDVGANQNLEIHFCFGDVSNFWQCNIAFIPPEHAWAEFTVNMRDSTNFTKIIDFTGTSTFSQALHATDRVLIRHDNAPYIQSPDAILGEFGVDGFKIENSLVAVEPGAARGTRQPVMLAPPSPNPSSGTATFSFETFEDGPVRLAIVDARGRVLRSDRYVPTGIGRHTWTWDGRDDAGRLVGAGVYRVRAWGAAGGTSRAIVRVD